MIRPSVPSDAGEERVQVVAGHVLDRLAAGLQDPAVREHHGEAEDVVAGHAVLQAARAAGVAGDVAADGGMADARRVGRIEEAVLFDFGLQVRRDDSGLALGRSRWPCRSPGSGSCA